MTPKSEAQLKEVVLNALNKIAPEVDTASLDPDVDLREQMDIDSVDVLNFVIALHQQLGVEIPDADVRNLSTLNGCVQYLLAKVEPGKLG